MKIPIARKLALPLKICMLLSIENWYLVQFEDKGQLYSVLPSQKVHHISPDDMGTPFREGDYVGVEWPANGNL